MILYDTFIKQPKEVQLTDGRKIKHYYDGAGTLLKTIYYTASNTVLETWDFVGNMIYKNGQPYQMNTPEGRATYNAGVWTYEFDYKDHLGNTRVSFKANGSNLEKTAETAFDPWGVRMNIGSVNAFQNRFEMQNHEKESTFGLNRINFGARTANPTTGRFDRIDRYANKYSSLSSYQISANNPISIIDINGDSLNLKLIQNYDKLNNTSFVQTILNDLTSQTGLTYSIGNNGQLDYNKDSNGNAIISNNIGSQEARNIMIGNINNSTSTYARISPTNSSAAHGGTLINLNESQISKFIAGANNLDSRTMGWGMTLMHESLHTLVGGSLSDVPRGSGVGPIGDVENKMNVVRSELNSNGANYGIRQSYEAIVPGYSQKGFVPFDNQSLRALQSVNPSFNNVLNGMILINNSSKFISFQ